MQILSLEVSGKWVASGCLVASGHPVENRPCLEKKRAILHQGMEVGGSAKLGWVRKVKGSNPAAGIGHFSLEISDNYRLITLHLRLLIYSSAICIFD